MLDPAGAAIAVPGRFGRHDRRPSSTQRTGVDQADDARLIAASVVAA